jgi:hypothetical protein
MDIGLNRVAQQPRKMARAAKLTVIEHAVPSAAVCAGIGFGVGLVIAMALPSMRREPDPGMFERYSHKLLDAMSRVTPDWMNRK